MKSSIILIIGIIIATFLISFPKLLPGIPNAIDTGVHLFRIIYLNKNLQNGVIPLWNTDWYAGTPFLLFYPPLAFYLTSFFQIGDYVLLYKVSEVIFESFLIIAVYFLAKKFLKQTKLALLSTFLFIIASQNIWNFSVVDRFATFLEAFFIVCGLIFFIEFLDHKRARDKIITGVFFGLAFLSQGFGFLIILIILLFSKIVLWKNFRFLDLFFIILLSFLVALPWLILSAGSFLYYLTNPYVAIWTIRKFLDIPRIGAILFSLGLPSVVALTFKFGLIKKLKFLLAATLFLISIVIFFIPVPIKYNVTKSIMSFIFILSGFVTFTLNKNIYEFDQNLRYLFYLTLFLVILSSATFLYSFTPLGVIDPYRVAFYAAIPLSILTAYIFQKNMLGLGISVIVLLILSFVFFSTQFTKMLPLDEGLVTTLKEAPPGRMLMVEASPWMHILPALVDRPSIDGFSPFERFLPYYSNLNFSNYLGLWYETATPEQIQEVYDQTFLNVSKFGIKYILIQDNSSIKLPNYLDFETLYQKNGWKVLMLTQPISLIENGTLTVISPNELIILPQNDTVFLKQAYFPGWQASCGSIEKTIDGLTLIHNDNCEEIRLKYNPISALFQLFKILHL
jgi:hypothetical protein